MFDDRIFFRHSIKPKPFYSLKNMIRDKHITNNLERLLKFNGADSKVII